MSIAPTPSALTFWGAVLSTRAPVVCLRDMELPGSDELQCQWARADTDLLLSAQEPSKLLSQLWAHLFSTCESAQTSRRHVKGVPLSPSR